MRRNVIIFFAAILFTLGVSRFAAAQTPIKFDSETISGLGARNIGSATMSGRIAAVDAVQEGQRLTIFVGAASGGVWKSLNGGATYKPVFDKQPVQSIGAVTIDPKNPKVIWVGTGEAWTRNSVSIGDGVYKSTDGGENWTNMGLKNSERIAKILVDPNSDDTVYVCAPGKLWSDSEERGLYKTSDGGKTWTRILAGANLSTGCSMAMVPRPSVAAVCLRAQTAARRGRNSMKRARRVCPRNRGAASRWLSLLRSPARSTQLLKRKSRRMGFIVRTIMGRPGDISIVVRT